MNKTNILFISASLGVTLFCHSCGSINSGETASEDYARYVNPFIGASTNVEDAGAYHGLGKTFPGATTPYGMVQANPNTISGGDNAPGYSYEHNTIEGFSLTQMSGVGWFGEMGNFQVMPTSGALSLIAGKEDGTLAGYRSAYDKASETAKAGYYSVNLTDYGIRAETSATAHCGIMHFTFPENETSRIQVDLAHRMGGTAESQYVRIINDSTFCGWIRCTPDCGGWGDGDGNVDYTLWFYGSFSKPMERISLWSADIADGVSRHKDDVNSIEYQQNISRARIYGDKKEITGRHIGFFSEFPTKEGDTVDLTVGISYVDAEGARGNYMSEIAGKSFDTVCDEAYNAWNRELSKVKISGGTEDQKRVFYTALYHTMIDPRICSDADGRYMAADGMVRKDSGKYSRRTVFSGWDVFRSQFPLQTIINPGLVSDEINSLINLADESGRKYFERWELLNAYSGCMIGNPALPVIADAYIKGIRTFDTRKALQYCVNTSDKFGTVAKGYSPEPLSVSNTLEYAYADWCVAQLAKSLGETGTAEEMMRRSGAYKNVFSKEAGWFRPRYENGEWAAWNPEESMTKEWFGCIESNLYQQGWFVPHDVPGLCSLIGGRERMTAMLDSLFDNTPEDMKWNQYYNHANEPVHFVPFLYNHLGLPWMTQQRTRHICQYAYSNKVEGLVGNEDAGQMSAWYVLASAGIHPACPGDTRMEITSPVFDNIEFSLDSRFHKGEKFKIIAHDNSIDNKYIDHALLNGKPYNKCYLDFSDISNGATLELFMSATPNKSWGME